MPSALSVYEAKTHLPQLLERVAGGERITITKHGHSVAVLQPVEGSESVKEAIRNLKNFRCGKSLKGLSIKEGRR